MARGIRDPRLRAPCRERVGHESRAQIVRADRDALLVLRADEQLLGCNPSRRQMLLAVPLAQAVDFEPRRFVETKLGSRERGVTDGSALVGHAPGSQRSWKRLPPLPLSARSVLPDFWS